MASDINQDGFLNEQDAFILYQVYLPALRGTTGGVTPGQRARAEDWRREFGLSRGGDINGDGRINEYDALIMVFAYQFGDLLENNADLRRLYFNGLRGSGQRQMLDTDATYQEFLRRALRLR